MKNIHEKYRLTIFLFLLIPLRIPGQVNPLTIPERTNFTQTSRYDDILQLYQAYQKSSPYITLNYFGTSRQGKNLPLVLIQKPARKGSTLNSNKPFILIVSNVHPGEVEGKEAVQILTREIAGGKHLDWFDQFNLLIVPDFDVDGNENISTKHRVNQNGPESGVGDSEPDRNFNRDYMKLEITEVRALVRSVMNTYDPILMMDLHTTNGSYHGYHLTYEVPLHPSTPKEIVQFQKDSLFTRVTADMLNQCRYRIFYYGNYCDENANYTDQRAEIKGWRTFEPRPRFGTNYYGLRNRFAILCEGYSYLDFKTRIDAMLKFVTSILDFSSRHIGKMKSIVRKLDADYSKGLLPAESGIEFQFTGKPGRQTILTGDVDSVRHSDTGLFTFQMRSETTPIQMLHFGNFEIKSSISTPAAYILPAGMDTIIQKLSQHGIKVEKIKRKWAGEVEEFSIDSLGHSDHPFQGHRETKVTGKFQTVKKEFPAGSFMISMVQPKANLIFYLLEARSDDGLVNWNYFDPALTQQKIYPVYRIPRKNPK